MVQHNSHISALYKALEARRGLTQWILAILVIILTIIIATFTITHFEKTADIAEMNGELNLMKMNISLAEDNFESRIQAFEKLENRVGVLEKLESRIQELDSRVQALETPESRIQALENRIQALENHESRIQALEKLEKRPTVGFRRVFDASLIQIRIKHLCYFQEKTQLGVIFKH